MKAQPRLTYWQKRMHKKYDGGDIPCSEWDRQPYCATAQQEDRHRRLVDLLSECEEEITRLRRLDPKKESDQIGCLHGERSELERFVFNHAGTLGLNDDRHQSRRDRVLGLEKGRQVRNLQERTVRRMKDADRAYAETMAGERLRLD